MVTAPVVPPRVPELLFAGMLMMAELLEVNVVEVVTSVVFSIAVKVTVVFVPWAPMLMGVAGFEVTVRVVELPAVMVIVPVTTVPLEDCAAACTVTAVPGVVTAVAVTRPWVVVLRVTKPVGVAVQVADAVRSL
jgi:hypothetical protein